MVTINTKVQNKLAEMRTNAAKTAGESKAPTSAPTPTVKAKEKSFHVYYHSLKSCRMITKEGRTLSFVDGRYVTDVVSEIEYLNAELELGNYQLSTVPGKEVMTTTQLDPMKALKERFIQEYIEEEANKKALFESGKGPSSISTPQPLIPGSTETVGTTAAGSTSTDS